MRGNQNHRRKGKIVYDGHELDPTIEGPKLYKRNGYYYIFAPAGGVATGWQLVLRSKNIYGPYERKVVMDQGKSNINGPHQGAWVNTLTGEDWFLHFQDKDQYGRVVHLNPMKWINDWPVIGDDKDGDGKGEPVSTFRKPNAGKTYPVQTPADSDEFNDLEFGLQWQWPANPSATWSFMNMSKGSLRLYSQNLPDSGMNLWAASNVLQQKWPAEEFILTTKMTFTPNTKLPDEKAGLAVMGSSYANLALKNSPEGLQLVYTVYKDAGKGNREKETVLLKAKDPMIFLRVTVERGAMCSFSYSLDGKEFSSVGEPFKAEAGKWKGSKVGLFCTRHSQTNDAGYADFDWFRFEPLK